MEKAIEIKRRAQRCVQNGDLDGALREYEKLVETPESDPYNFVLLADLLYKKGDQPRAAERYLNAVSAYEKASLYKNAIAVCKKMMRLSLSPALVLKHLAELHALDGLTSEASIYYSQYAEHMVRVNNPGEAVAALRKAFDNGQENVRLLEQLAEVMMVDGQEDAAAGVWLEAAGHWTTRGQGMDARRCEEKANQLKPGSAKSAPAASAPPSFDEAIAAATAPASELTLEPAATTLDPTSVAPAPLQLETTSLSAPATPATTNGDFTIERRPDALPVNPAPALPGLTTSAATPGAPVAESGIFERAPRFAPPSAPVELVATPPVPESPAPVAAVEPVVASTPVEADRNGDNEDGEFVEHEEGVYEIAAEEAPDYEEALHEVEAKLPDNVTPLPVPQAQHAHPTPSTIAHRPEGLLEGVSLVENLLQRAQEEFRAGNREKASAALVEAALTYEQLGRLDSAATIFRSLGRGAQAPLEVMKLWLGNCEKRGDRTEGSQVACELGDRALNDGDETGARHWFEHALAIDANHETARRRLQRMDGQAPDNVLPMPAPPAAPAAVEPGRVEVALGRGQAVTFDLSGLLSEFQRGVETQLEGDSQGHYDLGMAYREMGLHEQAITSFRISEREPRLSGRSREMIGRCLADTGAHDEAIAEFQTALATGSLDGAGEAELRYQLSLSMAALGDLAGAVQQLETADAHYPGRPDILERLTQWRSAARKAA